jgi:hypothetical protein
VERNRTIGRKKRGATTLSKPNTTEKERKPKCEQKVRGERV